MIDIIKMYLLIIPVKIDLNPSTPTQYLLFETLTHHGTPSLWIHSTDLNYVSEDQLYLVLLSLLSPVESRLKVVDGH